MKLPNGYGGIVKLPGKRRNPFAVRITAGWECNEQTGKTKQIYKNIGYYKTRQAAMIALAEYNKNPYDIDSKKVTFSDVYNLWMKDKHKQGISDTNKRGYESVFKLSSSLHGLKFIDIRKAHMQDIIDKSDKSHSTKSLMKTLYGQLYKFALENDITDKNYASFVIVPKNNTGTTRKPFTDAEIQLLWDKLYIVNNVDAALIMIYTGMRPGELVLIESDNINLKERHMLGGIKTEAGKERIIPINKKIHPLIEKRMNQDNKYLFTNSRGQQLSYNSFRKYRWYPLMEELGMTHTAHECRHTFATLMNNANANALSVKKIMGHASQDITDKIYTHKSVGELINAIDLI